MSPAGAQSDAGSRPNILVVVVDDAGWRDVGFNGGGFETPNIDAMAAEGVTLSQFYVAPTCTPTRAQLMTGRYNFRTGMQDSVIHSTEPRGVPLSEPFLGQKLQTLGYATAQVGKWHLGMHMPQYTPAQRGFNSSYGILTGGGDHYGHISLSQSFAPREGNGVSLEWAGKNLVEDGVPSNDNPVPVHSTELYGAKAREYASKLADGGAPWFMYLAFQAVHDPIDTDESWYTDNACADIVDPVAAAREAAEAAAAAAIAARGAVAAAAATSGAGASISVGLAQVSFDLNATDAAAAALSLAMPPGTEPEAGRADDGVDWKQRKVLCGMMAQIDDELGRLRTRLESLGEWDSTVVFFLSDNGGIRSHGSVNLPFAGEKGTTWEGGVRVPAFIGGGFAAKRLAANGLEPYTFDKLWHVTDLHTTALRLAGATAAAAAEPTPAPKWPKLDGIDQWEAVISTQRQLRGSAVLHLNSAMFGGSGAVIMPPYKLIRNPDPRESAFFNKVRSRLSASPYSISHSLLSTETREALKELSLAEPEYLLFDLDKNPGERTDGACAEAVACSSVWGSSEYATEQAQLLHFFHTEAATAVDSTFRWEDDGPLANPGNFGGVWLPWRDADGFPLAGYGGLADAAPVGDFAGASFAATTSAALRLSGGRDGLSWAVGAAAFFGVAAAVVVGTITFRLGRRWSYNSLVL